jgi:carbon-monoxide dehydrogenase medium subunit
LTRHAEVLSSPLIARHVPLLAAAAPWVAHPAIRNKGTLGGSLALADPASEFPAVALALDASIELDSGERVRRVKASDFFLDLYETAIEPGEILTAIWFPCARRDERFAFGELARRRGDYALAGVAMAAQFRDDVIDDIRIVFLSVGRTPLRASAAEAALTGQRFTHQAIRTCRVAVAQDLIDASEDVQTSAAARRHLAGVLLERQLDGLRQETAA